jgi:hypothetical protein
MEWKCHFIEERLENTKGVNQRTDITLVNESFTVANIAWSTVTEDIGHK